uniref:putative late blight resistance protein homolog R1A-10 n=1 Tax=Erigeron canadensis TaxID=72917 RepID=UPI001CB9C30F|nr:putative late blight resistance protein homolog R1A-10 [Erigeron canadensis]
MADSLGLCLKEFRRDFTRKLEKQNDHHLQVLVEDSCFLPGVFIETMHGHLNGLMNHLQDMMLGYENEEVQALLKDLKEMKEVIGHSSLLVPPCLFPMPPVVRAKVKEMFDNKTWFVLVAEMDDMLEKVRAKVLEILVNEGWLRHEETSMDWMLNMVNVLAQGIWLQLTRYRREIEKLERIIVICEKLCNIRFGSKVVREEILVGFDNEIETLLHQLTGTSNKKLEILSITGMAGIGKTTLARELYSHPLVEYIFDLRAWTCVSQVYVKKDTLINILSYFNNKVTDEIYKMSDEQLGEKLYRLLKGRKYLIVFDDVWDCKAWNDLKMYLPDDKIGSRVLFTRRDIDTSLHVQAARPAHVLRLRTEIESWDIFQKKMFRTGICPPLLENYGRVITRKCEGLPLAIVIAAGLLKNNWSNSWWRQVAESLSSYMVSDPSQYMDSLALSYNHLPSHLKPCFLFLGSFPEDYEVPVTKLIWLWIAQGFIQGTGSRVMEVVAEDILMDLIQRSLLMTSKTRADGRIKACRIHDLLRDFCFRISEEENFSLQSYKNAPVPASSITITEMGNGISTDPSPLPTYTGLCYPSELVDILKKGGSISNETYKSLRILDMEYVPISVFPCDVLRLTNLRYLAIQAHDGSPPASISKLVSLQMLIIRSRKNVLLPKTIWNMLNMRHLYIKSGENLVEEPNFVQITENDGSPNLLHSLQTLSQISPLSCQNLSPRVLNLRKLGFCGPLISSLGDLEFPNLRSLQHLRKLKLLNTIPYPEATRSCNPLIYPENLKNLTLSNTGMDWEEMWTFAWLPNLEVLKLKVQACIGETWETGDAEFTRLKVLKLHDLDIKEWVSSKDNFPRLQRLIIHRCLNLHSIPLDLGSILTLEVLEVRGCSISAHNSALEIQKEQENVGNSFLKLKSTQKPY